MLENNSNEMKTFVETFVIEETAELIYDNEKLDEWNRMIEELNLKGQSQIVKKDKSPIPFMHLKQSMVSVFETLCPRKVAVEDYDVTPIPVEILSLISLSKKENYFNKVEIWYDEKSPDPVCVGMVGEYYECDWYSDSNKSLKNTTFSTHEEAKNAGAKHISFREKNKYLLGKWGDVKHSFKKLKEMATERYIAEQTFYYQKRIKESQYRLSSLEEEAFNRFN